jgi:hypothetical protein
MTKYNPKFHPKDLLKKMETGKLNVQVWASWKVSKKTFYEWVKDYPEMAEAYAKGEASCEAWWIQKMVEKFEAGDDKGFKYCKLICDTKFGYSRDPNTVNNTQINIQGNMNVLQEKSSPELFEILQEKLKSISQYTDVRLLDDHS